MAKIIHPGLPQAKLGRAAYVKAWRARTGNTSHKYEVKKRTLKVDIQDAEAEAVTVTKSPLLTDLETRLAQIGRQYAQ